MSRVLITGNGFIAAHVAERYITNGAEVCVASRSPGWRLTPFQGRFLSLPLTLPDVDAAEDVLRTFMPEIIVHLAGVTPGRGADNTFLSVNRDGTRDILEAARHAPSVRHVITLGSASEYGLHADTIDESSECTPLDAYGTSKLEATRTVADFSAHFRRTVLRPCTIYGEAQTFSMLIPLVIRACIAKTPLSLTPLAQEIDFLHINDLVDAIVRTPERLGDTFEILNIGSGSAIPVREVVGKIAALCDAENVLHVGALPYRAHEPFRRLLSIKKAARLLSWVPRISLDDGLTRTAAWYRDNQHRFSML